MMTLGEYLEATGRTQVAAARELEALEIENAQREGRKPHAVKTWTVNRALRHSECRLWLAALIEEWSEGAVTARGIAAAMRRKT